MTVAGPNEPLSGGTSVETATSLVAAYKTILRDVLDRRPSGTRQRLATALGKNRSFISQITNPTYPVPIPAPHLLAIVEICHLSASERTAFLNAYRRAHPNRVFGMEDRRHLRALTLVVPDLGSAAANRAFDDVVRAFVAERSATAKRPPFPGTDRAETTEIEQL